MIIDGKQLSKEIKAEIKQRVEELKQKYNEVPTLAIILVGNDPASETYVKNKDKAINFVGMEARVIHLEEDTKEEKVLSIIDELNKDDKINGILIQLPLPKHINTNKVINRVKATKDVDGLTEINTGRLALGAEAVVPCTPAGVIKLIESTGETIEGKHAVIIGRSILVGKPVAQLLLQKNATVTMCHSKTKDLKSITSQADILVVAIGNAKFIKEDMVKEGAIVIDVGINRVDGKVVGDVDFDNVSAKASHITPVPGGCGPMTITMLIENTIKCYLMQKENGEK